jgi:hypothetical protein
MINLIAGRDLERRFPHLPRLRVQPQDLPVKATQSNKRNLLHQWANSRIQAIEGPNRMAKYLQRSWPRCNDYLGIVVPERKVKLAVQAVMDGA